MKLNSIPNPAFFLIASLGLVFITITACRKSNPVLTATVEGVLLEHTTKEPLPGILIRLDHCARSGPSTCKVLKETYTRQDGTFSITYTGRQKTDYYVYVPYNDTLWNNPREETHPDWEKYQMQLTVTKLTKARLRIIIRKNEAKGDVWVENHHLPKGTKDTVLLFKGSPDVIRDIPITVMDSVAGYRRGTWAPLLFKRDHSNIQTIEIPDMQQLQRVL